MISDVLNPLLMGVGVCGAIRDVVAGYIKVFVLADAKMANSQSAVCMGELDLQRVDFDDLNPPGLLTAMSFLNYVKKGVSAVFCAK